MFIVSSLFFLRNFSILFFRQDVIFIFIFKKFLFFILEKSCIINNYTIHAFSMLSTRYLVRRKKWKMKKNSQHLTSASSTASFATAVPHSINRTLTKSPSTSSMNIPSIFSLQLNSTGSKLHKTKSLRPSTHTSSSFQLSIMTIKRTSLSSTSKTLQTLIRI